MAAVVESSRLRAPESPGAGVATSPAAWPARPDPPRLAVLVLAALSAVAVLPSQAAAQDPLVEQVRWFAGCWEGTLGGGRTYEEVWLPPRGRTMVGMSRTVREGRTVGHESLRIFQEQDRLVYWAHPSGQDSARFTATEVADSSVVFSNPDHDFPQRIVYRLVAPDSLHARIEGGRNGGTRTVDFPMGRVLCP